MKIVDYLASDIFLKQCSEAQQLTAKKTKEAKDKVGEFFGLFASFAFFAIAFILLLNIHFISYL